jgi:hypothetical protein
MVGKPKELLLGLVLGILVAGTVGAALYSTHPRLSPAAPSQTSLEIRDLQARVDLIVAYQEVFLDTVLWGLGMVGAIGVLLVGYNWFSSSIVQERERAAILLELRAAQLAAVGAAKAELREHLISEVQSAATKLASAVAGLQNRLETEFVHRDAFDEVRIDVLLIHVEESDTTLKEAQGLDSNSVYGLGRLIQKAAALPWYFQEDYMGRALDHCRRMLDLTGRLEAEQRTKLLASLETVPQKYKAIARPLIERVGNL